jgi:nucleoside-diphosphate-sugar epimerase
LSFERSHFVGSLANKIKNSTGTIDMFGDGSGIRDFIYVNDAAESICRYCELGKATNSVSNISTGQGTKIGDLTEQLVNISRRNLKIKWGDPKDTGILYKVLNNSKMLQDINYQPTTTLKR